MIIFVLFMPIKHSATHCFHSFWMSCLHPAQACRNYLTNLSDPWGGGKEPESETKLLQCYSC